VSHGDSHERDEVARAYDRWAATYDTDQNATRDLDAQVLRASELPIQSRDVLELGCGTGKNTVWLAAQARSLTAMDFSDGMIAHATRRVAGSPIEVKFLRHDVREPWPIERDAVDVVVGNLVLEHVSDVGAVFREAARVLRSGGIAYFCELHPDRQARGGQAQFSDVESGERVYVTAYVHTVDEFARSAADAGLTIERLVGHVEDGAPAGAPPRLIEIRLARP
jgi:ubiquinone/menaquinone biosynthesis C-methylase UbiE